MRPVRWALVPMLLAAVAGAQEEQKLLRQQFEAFDMDRDGALARAEFPGSDRQFAQMDKDGDGKVTAAEFTASDVAQRFLRTTYRNRAEPRPRATPESLALQRLALLGRWDRNRDGKVTREEWTGTDAAFASLDLDGDGVIDRRDLAEARAAAPEPEPPLPGLRADLAAEEILKRLDKDGDGKVGGREFERMKELQAALPRIDRDRDGMLDLQELRNLVQTLAMARAGADASGTRPQPYQVPFAEWDKDQNGRVELNEWQGPRGVFEAVDRNRDAAVTREEIARYVKLVTGADFLARFDQDGDGKVTLDEFGGPPSAFQRLDRNGDGAVNRADR